MSNGKRSRGRPKSVQRQPAIDIAMKTYWQEGLHAHSINALCQQLGMSKPSFYREFGGEDGLMVAALERYHQLAIAPLLALLASDKPVEQILDAAIVWLTGEHGTPAGCLFTQMRLSLSRLGEEATARVRAIEQERREAFAACCRRGIESGAVKPDIETDFAAYYIDAQLTAALVLRAAGEPPERVQAQARLAMKALLAVV